MKTNSNVVEVKYDEIYEFVAHSKDTSDFVERLQLVCLIIVNELADRMSEKKLYMPIQIVPLIDEMNEEVVCFVENVNTTKIVDNQPKVEHPLLIRLIQMNSARLYNDYMYAKTALQN
jgi:hypothetical protein